MRRRITFFLAVSIAVTAGARERLVVAMVTPDGTVSSKCEVTLGAGQEFNRLAKVQATPDGGWLLATTTIGDGSTVIKYGPTCVPAWPMPLRVPYSVHDLLETADGTLYLGTSENDRATVHKARPAPGEQLATVDFPGVSESLGVLRVDAQGRLLFAGHSNYKAMLARALTKGGLDPAFGTGGIARTTAPGGIDPKMITDFALGRDGSVVAIESHSPGFVLLGFGPDGAVDSGFGEQGMVQTELREWGRVFTVDGAFLAAGLILKDDEGWAVAIERYDARGKKDLSFGDEGRVLVPMLPYYPELDAIVPARGGGFVAALVAAEARVRTHPVLVRVNARGFLGFGNSGVRFDPVDEHLVLARWTVTRDGNFLLVGSAR